MKAEAAVVAAGLVASLAATAAAQLPAPPSGRDGETVAIRDVRVFDGRAAHEGWTVVFAHGRIVEAGVGVEVPDEAVVVDGAGRTLLPGLIDAHTHVFSDAHLREALAWGVTTELDQFTDEGFAGQMRAAQAAGDVTHRADLFSAGVLATAPGGHGTQFGLTIPTLTGPADAEAFVAARVDAGADWIKIVWEDGSTYGMALPTLDELTAAAVIDAAHDADRPALVHVATRDHARRAAAVGADGLVHAPHDGPPAPDLGETLAEAGLFVVPTLTVIRSIATGTEGDAQLSDARLGDALDPAAEASIRAAYPPRPSTEALFDHGVAVVAQLRDAGVAILAGTDAPNPGTAHGLSIHRELELLVEAGLTPAEALAAATAAPAEAVGLSDRGRIASGLRADLVLVDGDPTTTITDTRNLAAVWRNGGALDLIGVRARLAEARRRAGQALPVPGPLSDFDDGTTAVAFGAGWLVSTDRMAGGSSTATLEPVDGHLTIAGEVAGGGATSWAGGLFFVGDQPMAPADASAAAGVRFRVRGEAGTSLTVMVFSQGTGTMPSFQSRELTGEWQTVELPFASFAGATPESLMGVFLGAAGRPGPFTFDVDDVMFY